MPQLSGKAFDRAGNFITNSARSLERALFDYHFGSGSGLDVLIKLKKFQNEEGGFGQGIEPDLRMPVSSPFSISVALQVLQLTYLGITTWCETALGISNTVKTRTSVDGNR